MDMRGFGLSIYNDVCSSSFRFVASWYLIPERGVRNDLNIYPGGYIHSDQTRRYVTALLQSLAQTENNPITFQPANFSVPLATLIFVTRKRNNFSPKPLRCEKYNSHISSCWGTTTYRLRIRSIWKLKITNQGKLMDLLVKSNPVNHFIAAIFMVIPNTSY